MYPEGPTSLIFLSLCHLDKPKEGSKLQKWTEPPKINSSSPEMTEMDVIQENLDLKREVSLHVYFLV